MKRPAHQDVLSIDLCLIDNRAPSESFRGHMSRIVDPASVTYQARERVRKIMGDQLPDETVAQIAAIWVDAFLTGAKYQALKELASDTLLEGLINEVA